MATAAAGPAAEVEHGNVLALSARSLVRLHCMQPLNFVDRKTVPIEQHATNHEREGGRERERGGSKGECMAIG